MAEDVQIGESQICKKSRQWQSFGSDHGQCKVWREAGPVALGQDVVCSEVIIGANGSRPGGSMYDSGSWQRLGYGSLPEGWKQVVR